ncbi:MAG: nucleoside hydrolase [Candidatus Choladocola sp.]|nr:nucleoside hydrolase [Candidatus Choladocola sp.]
MQYNILFDCDPGIDDAVAFAVAAAYPDVFRLHGITTVAGNQTIERVTGNALKLTDFLGMDVKVAQGAEAPLLREIVPAADVHGKTGLGNCVLPETDRKTAAECAPEFMYRRICELPEGEKMVLVPTGPLTNVALLLKAFPDCCDRIDRIVLMGGSMCGGNITETAEFNIWEDPEAAAVVFRSGIPIVMCGLDVTSQCGLNKEQVEKLKNSSLEKEKAYGEMMDFYFHCSVYESQDRIALHDAVTFMYLLHPELFSGREMAVTVDCSEGLNRGMTVCDGRSWSDAKKNALVLLHADSEKFEKYLLQIIRSFG